MSATRPKGYYLHYRDLNDLDRNKTGIDLKVEDQISALNELGCECEFVFCPQPETTLGMVKSCLPFMPDGIAWPNVKDLEDADYLYIRIPRFISKEMISFLEKNKRHNPDSLVILEVPTYPYDVIMKNWKLFFALMKDRVHRGHLARYVDYISDLSGTEQIFGIDTVQIINGINLERVQAREIGERHPSEFNVMCSSFYRDYHGIDRLIYGLANYYESKPEIGVNLYLAGGGDELPNLKKMVARLGLEQHVLFPGILGRDDLDALYDKCSLAVGVLGLHRTGAETTSALKTREYLAKGMPFIYSAKVDVFEKEPMDLCFNVPNDDSPVDVAEIVDFYGRTISSLGESCITRKIRDYANNNITMKIAMRRVAELIREQCSKGTKMPVRQCVSK